MAYEVVYDIATQPPFEIEVAWLAGGLFTLGAVWALVRKRQQRPPTTGYVIMGFASLLALIGVGLMSWDHHRVLAMLESGEAHVVEGPVQRWSTQEQRTARRDRHEYVTYESFYVGDKVWFGYHQQVGQAGFHNGGDPPIPLHDGLMVRATYAYADGDDDPPRILKLEIAR
jgi:hypothetical protein